MVHWRAPRTQPASPPLVASPALVNQESGLEPAKFSEEMNRPVAKRRQALDNQGSAVPFQAAMPKLHSMNAMIEKLRAGDEGAAAEVFGRFVCRLTALARVHLSRSMRSKEDAEDVIQSVFRSFFRRQRAGQFALESWDSIWGVLAMITLRKCGNRIEYFHAASRNVLREVSLADSAAWLAAAREPTPLEAATLTEVLENLMAGLEPTDRSVLTLHLQHYTVPEICAHIGYAERTVWRSLNRIRNRLRRLETEPD